MTSSGTHIYTLTGNLLAERTMSFDRWSPGGTYRAKAESFQVGGKGINVSRMLVRLGAPTTALCFTGGASGDECRAWLAARGPNHRTFGAANATHVGIVIRAPDQPETTFIGPDVSPGPAAVRECAAFLDAVPEGQVLAVCGSMPDWLSADYDPLRATLERWLKRGTLIADTYGPPLAWFAERPLALVKINATEFRTLPAAAAAVHSSGLTAADIAASTRGRPVRNWIVTDGARPVWLRVDGREAASVLPPIVKEISPTGSGDILLACVLEAWLRREKSLEHAVAYALPFAAANAAHAGVAEFPLFDHEPLR